MAINSEALIADPSYLSNIFDRYQRSDYDGFPPMPDDFAPVVDIYFAASGPGWLGIKVTHGRVGISIELAPSRFGKIPQTFTNMKRVIWTYLETERRSAAQPDHPLISAMAKAQNPNGGG